MIVNNTKITKQDILNIYGEKGGSLKSMWIAAVVLFVISIALFMTKDGYEPFIYLGLGLLVLIGAIVAKLMVRSQQNSIPEFTTYDYEFNEDSFNVSIKTNDEVTNSTINYSTLEKQSFENDIYRLYLSTYMFYMVKADSFKSDEDRLKFEEIIKGI